MDAFLRCRLSPGMFREEVAVCGKTAKGTEFSLFVPEEFIECDGTIDDSGPVDGWVRVEVLDRAGPLMLVRLPGQTFENGQTVTVQCSEVEQRRRCEAV